MNKSLLFLSIIFSTLSYGSEFCVRTQNDIKNLLSESESRIAFKNNGGLFNGGVCWWHSRLQRSSSYLVKYRPDLNPPTPEEVQRILSGLSSMNKVVVIPGYRNFQTFSHDYQAHIQRHLNHWQKLDGFYNFEWIRGISGKSELSSSAMVKHMRELYTFYKNTQAPLWIMAQIKGVTSHSLLVLNMSENETGYELDVIDSNHPLETVRIIYREGDKALHAEGEDYSFVPYAGFQKDLRLISESIKKECKNLVSPLANDIPDGYVELPYLQY